MFQQVFFDGAHTECQADVAELKHLLKETRENFQERIASLERNEMKLYERIATNEATFEERITRLGHRLLDNEAKEKSEPVPTVLSLCM